MTTIAVRPPLPTTGDGFPVQPQSSTCELPPMDIDEIVRRVLLCLDPSEDSLMLAIHQHPPELKSALGLEALLKGYGSKMREVGKKMRNFYLEFDEVLDDATMAAVLNSIAAHLPDLVSFSFAFPVSGADLLLPLACAALRQCISSLQHLTTLTVHKCSHYGHVYAPDCFIDLILTTIAESTPSTPCRLTHLNLPLPGVYLSPRQESHHATLHTILSLSRASSSLTHIDFGPAAVLIADNELAVLSILENQNPWLESLCIRSEGEMMDVFKRRALARNKKLRGECWRAAIEVRTASIALFQGSGKGRLPVELMLQVVHELESVALSWRQVEEIVRWASGQETAVEEKDREEFLREVDCLKYDGEGIRDGRW